MKLKNFLKSKNEALNLKSTDAALFFFIIGLLAEAYLPLKFQVGQYIFHLNPLPIVNLALAGVLAFPFYVAATLVGAAFYLTQSFGFSYSGWLAALFYAGLLIFWFYALKAIYGRSLRPVVKITTLFSGFLFFFTVLCLVIHFGQDSSLSSSGEVLFSGISNLLIAFILLSWLNPSRIIGRRYSRYLLPFFIFFTAVLILITLVFFNLSSVRLKLIFNAFEQSLVEEVKAAAEHHARHYAVFAEDRFSAIVSHLKTYSNLPGVHWRTRFYSGMISQRLSETLAQFGAAGVEGVYIVSEEGKVEFSAGSSPDKDLSLVFKQSRWIFPEEWNENINPLTFFNGNNLYICVPIYRSSFSPSDRQYPDFKRNGFLIARLNFELFLRTVQSRYFEKGGLHYFVYFVDGKPHPVSYSADISMDRKTTAALTSEVIEFASKAAERGVDKAQSGRYVLAAVPLKLGDTRVLSVYCFDGEKEIYLIRKTQQEIRNRSIATYIAVILVFIGSYLILRVFFRRLERALMEKEHELEKEVKKKFELLKVVVENMPIGFVLCDTEGNIRLMNAFGRLFLERDTGKLPANIGETSFAAAFSKCRETKGITRIDVISAGRILGVTCSHFEYAGESLFALVLSDITEVRAAQQAALVESRTLLLGEIAKSLNDLIVKPVQVALAQTGLLKVREGISEEDKKILENIEQQLEIIANTAATYLSLEADFGRQERTVFDFSEALQSALRILRPVLERYDVDVRINTDRTVFVAGNWTRMQLVLLTIINYVVEILKETKGQRRIIINSDDSDDRAVIKISFTAPAPSSEIEEALEKPFYTDSETGASINLFIARELLERDGGILLFKTKPEGQSEFILDLPKK